MENIIEPNDSFDFSKLTLAHPTGIQGGAYFTKIEYKGKPLYVQTTKSSTRQGFVKTGKKYYCDLMFDNNSSSLINWFENLEEKCQKLIYDKSETWFENALDVSDIETAFNSIIRVYRSGKFYLVRTNVKNSPLTNEPVIKIYDENQAHLTLKDVTSDTNIISILEIQGIKFTSRNFQIEIELKQVMVLNEEPIFDNCLIKTKNDATAKNEPIVNSLLTTHLEDAVINTNDDVINNTNADSLYNSIVSINAFDSGTQENPNTTDELLLEASLDDLTPEIVEPTMPTTDTRNNKDASLDINLEIEELRVEDLEEPKDLKEVQLDLKLGNDLESFTLKNRNQVYKELYKEARGKAKLAKKNAILAYLEAKNIKKTYMIESLNDSDSDFDAEIDEVSESELEGL